MKKRLMIAGSGLNEVTGLAYVSSSLLARFSREYDVSYMTLTGSDTTKEKMVVQGDAFAERCADIKLYNCTDITNQYSQVDTAITTERPHVVLTVGDPWTFGPLSYSQYRDSYNLVSYTTIEVPGYPETIMRPHPRYQTAKYSIREVLSLADLVVPVTALGAQLLDQWNIPRSEPVPLGLDWLNRRSAEQKSVVFGNDIDDDCFLFMTLGVNSYRKKIDRVVEAFDLFMNKVGNTRYKLYVHTDYLARSKGTDLVELVIRKGLGKQVVFPEAGKVLPQHELFRRYACSDCFISLAGGEGYGYGVCEAMMHRVPVIYSDYGGHTEFARNGGIPVKIADYFNAEDAYIRFALADIEDAAKKMARIVNEPRLRSSLGEKGYEYVRGNLSWDITFPKLSVIVGKVLETTSVLSGIPIRRVV